MAHAWWRDADYVWFYRLTKERDEARAEVERLRAGLRTVAERQREACAAIVEDADDGVPLQCLADAVRAAPLATGVNK